MKFILNIFASDAFCSLDLFLRIFIVFVRELFALVIKYAFFRGTDDLTHWKNQPRI